VTVVFTTHRPVDISAKIRSIVDYWCVFHTTQELDLRTLSGYLDATTLARVQRLPPYQFVVWDDTKGTARTVTNAQSWYRPLTKADVKPHTRPSAIETLQRDGESVREMPLFDKPSDR
jgi:hypothetical protein